MKRLFLALTLIAGAAQASPWAEGGDRQFRQDIEMLKAARIIRGPINAWPLPWAQIDNGIAFNEGVVLPPHLMAALARVKAQSDLAQQRTVYEFKAAGTNDPELVRDFGGGARENGDVSVRATHDVGPLYLSYGVGYRNHQRGGDLHFEPSYAAVQIGNWALYGGYVEEWFGPGHDGALLFSNSARPFPKIGIKRLSPDPIGLPVLKWLGPIRLDVFAGKLMEKRDFDNPLVIGIRVAFEPVHGLEIGLNRAMQLCGKNRPCSARTIGEALIGFGNADNTGTLNEPGNQLAGFDISFTRQVGNVTTQIYAEAEAEDEDNIIIEQYARLAGIALSGPLGESGASWQANFEFTDTLGSQLFGGNKYPGSLYNHFIYRDGFTDRIFARRRHAHLCSIGSGQRHAQSPLVRFAARHRPVPHQLPCTFADSEPQPRVGKSRDHPGRYRRCRMAVAIRRYSRRGPPAERWPRYAGYVETNSGTRNRVQVAFLTSDGAKTGDWNALSTSIAWAHLVFASPLR